MVDVTAVAIKMLLNDSLLIKINFCPKSEKHALSVWNCGG